MKPNEYWKSLEEEEKEDWAVTSGTTFLYLQKHIFRGTGISRRPGWEIVIGLSQGSCGNVSIDESIDYFLVNPCKKLAKELEKPPSGTLEEAA